MQITTANQVCSRLLLELPIKQGISEKTHAQLFQYCSFSRWNVSIWPCSTEIALKAVFRKCAQKSTKLSDTRCHLVSLKLIIPPPFILEKYILNYHVTHWTWHIGRDTLSQNFESKCLNSIIYCKFPIFWSLSVY